MVVAGVWGDRINRVDDVADTATTVEVKTALLSNKGGVRDGRINQHDRARRAGRPSD